MRKPGMFESLEDTISQVGVIPGWSTMTNRWLEWTRLKLGFKGADLVSAANLLLAVRDRVPPGHRERRPSTT
jgi:hypothetical protein